MENKAPAEQQNHSVRFDGTVNAGHVLTAIVMTVAMFGVYTANQIQLTRLDMRIDTLEKTTLAVRVEQDNARKSLNEVAFNQVRVSTILERIERQTSD